VEITDTVTFNPKVSIIIPVYNGSNYLGEAIDSALAQTYKNIEIIVVNDGSDDGRKTEEIALSYGAKIRYFYKDNGGVASALNLGIREMTGEYFSWLSHDDVYYPNKIEAQIDYLRNMKKDIVLYSDYEFIDHESRFLKKKILKAVEPQKFRLALIVSDPVNGCTLLIPKICFELTGLFNEGLRTTQDYELWFRMAKNFTFVHIPRVLFKSRKHLEQGIYTISNHFKECAELYMWCLRELSVEEIAKITDEPLALFYVKVAIRLKIKGYTDVSKFAVGLSKKYLDKETIFIFLQRIILLIFYRLLNRKLKPKYWVNAMKVRLRDIGN
jgi:glycosyltransferase involved in cell wall biosynthesis